MSSWLVSLRWIGRRVVGPGRYPKKRDLGAACVLNSLFNVGPGRLVAEPRPQIVQQRCNLAVIHAAGKTRHDRAALSFHASKPRQHDVGDVARVGASDGGRKRTIEPAIGQRPAGLMAWSAARAG